MQRRPTIDVDCTHDFSNLSAGSLKRLRGISRRYALGTCCIMPIAALRVGGAIYQTGVMASGADSASTIAGLTRNHGKESLPYARTTCTNSPLKYIIIDIHWIHCCFRFSNSLKETDSHHAPALSRYRWISAADTAMVLPIITVRLQCIVLMPGKCFLLNLQQLLTRCDYYWYARYRVHQSERDGLPQRR